MDLISPKIRIVSPTYDILCEAIDSIEKMNAPVKITYFDSESRLQFLKSDMSVLGDRKMVSAKEGTIVVLMDNSCGVMFGLALIKNAPGSSSPCIKTHPLDPETYSGKYSQYNTYQIYTKEVKIFKTPIPHSQIREMIGAPEISGHGNMWTKNRFNFCTPFHKGVDAKVIERYNLWINTMMNA